MSKEALQELNQVYNGWIAQKAQIALELTEKFESGEMLEDEYKELMTDLARLDDVAEESETLEMKTALVTAIYGVAQLA